MTVMLHLVEEVKSSFPKKLYTDIFQATLAVSRFQTEDGFRLFGKKVTLHAIAVSEEKMRRLNKTYRHRNAATDVLSFGQEPPAGQATEIFLGELFFSPRFIRRQARSAERSTARANRLDGYLETMIYIFSHGILHLLGYDHGKEMFAWQDEVTDRVFADSRRSGKTLQKKKNTKKRI